MSERLQLQFQWNCKFRKIINIYNINGGNMQVKELIETLQKVNGNKKVLIVDKDTGGHCNYNYCRANAIIETEWEIIIFWGNVYKYELEETIMGEIDGKQYKLLFGEIKEEL